MREETLAIFMLWNTQAIVTQLHSFVLVVNDQDIETTLAKSGTERTPDTRYGTSIVNTQYHA